MKRIVILIVLAAVSTTAFAQRAPQSTSYKDLKNYYSARDYVKSDTDPYSVFWIGLESLAAPGLGQLIMKETGRGWAFLGTSVVLGTAGGILAQNVANVDGTYSISEADRNKASGYLIALGGVALAQLARISLTLFLPFSVRIRMIAQVIMFAAIAFPPFQPARRAGPFSFLSEFYHGAP